MFTGLIQSLGKITEIHSNDEGKVFTICAPLLTAQMKIDDSVSTNGVCLTTTKILGDSFVVQAVHITLEKTNLHRLKTMDEVNLELALKPMDPLGGHFVQGHVGGVGEITNINKRSDNWEINVRYPKELGKYMILEGSIALDGISLTLAKLTAEELTVSVIPHTLEKTNLKFKNIGDTLNIEVDMLAKYLEKLFINSKMNYPFLDR